MFVTLFGGYERDVIAATGWLLTLVEKLVRWGVRFFYVLFVKGFESTLLFGIELPVCCLYLLLVDLFGVKPYLLGFWLAWLNLFGAADWLGDSLCLLGFCNPVFVSFCPSMTCNLGKQGFILLLLWRWWWLCVCLWQIWLPSVCILILVAFWQLNGT